MCPILTLVVRDPTCWCVMFFVGLFFVFLPPLVLSPRTAAVLRTIEDPNHDVFLVRKELRNQLEEIGVVLSL